MLAVRLRGNAVETAGTGLSEVTKTFAELFASCVEKPISARELFVTHCLVRRVSQNVHNRGVPIGGGIGSLGKYCQPKLDKMYIRINTNYLSGSCSEDGMLLVSALTRLLYYWHL